jgi:hypothetical protein
MLTQEVGPPSGGHYHCPGCNERKLYVRKPDRNGKTRFGCCYCGARGDEFDFLRLRYPDVKYPWLLARIEELKADYESDHPPTLRLSPKGREGSTKMPEFDQPRDVNWALAELWRELDRLKIDDGLELLEFLDALCKVNRVTLAGLVRVWKEGRNVYDQIQAIHAAPVTCADPEEQAELEHWREHVRREQAELLAEAERERQERRFGVRWSEK